MCMFRGLPNTAETAGENVSCPMCAFHCFLVCVWQACMEEFQRSGHRMGHLDNILQAALEFDLHQVIKDSR